MSHNSSKTDLRVRRTRKLLRDALVGLLMEKDFEIITVSDIAEQAMVNRATFYRHFRDKDDLLLHGIDDVLEDIDARLSQPISDSGQLNHEAPRTNLRLMLTHIRHHAAFYKVMLGQNIAGIFGNRLRDYLRDVVANRWRVLEKQHMIKATMPLDLILDFYASGYIGAISWWVSQDCPGTIEQMVENLMLLTTSTSDDALGTSISKHVTDKTTQGNQ